MTLKRIRAIEPNFGTVVLLEYDSIEQARVHNPYLKDFEYV